MYLLYNTKLYIITSSARCIQNIDRLVNSQQLIFKILNKNFLEFPSWQQFISLPLI